MARTISLDRNAVQHVKYLSMADMLRTLAEVEARTDTEGWCCKYSIMLDWFGGMTFSESVQAITYGWENAPDVKNVSLPNVETLTDHVEYFHDVTGNEFDAPAYFSGSHECFIDSFQETVRTNKVIKLAIEMGGSASVLPKLLSNRGEAVIALINSLELAGYSIELVVVNASITKKSKRFADVISVKEAGQALDMRRIQFLFTPMFYRRCLFALEESHFNESINVITTYSDNYKPAGYVHIPYSAGLCDSLQDSMKWAGEFAHSVVDVAATAA